MIIEIVILAAIAAFLGLRLYSVLGQRSEHEEEPVRHHFDAPEANTPPAHDRAPAPARDAAAAQGAERLAGANESAIRAIASADQNFDLIAFLEGAKGAYGMILEAFWQGDRDTLRELADEDVYQGFAAAIDAREEAGETLENRLIRIEDATVHGADLDGRIARIAVLFVSDIASLTRDKDGAVIAGSLDDAVESRDIWTFRRNVDAADPNWVLDETDQA